MLSTVLRILFVFGTIFTTIGLGCAVLVRPPSLCPHYIIVIFTVVAAVLGFEDTSNTQEQIPHEEITGLKEEHVKRGGQLCFSLWDVQGHD